MAGRWAPERPGAAPGESHFEVVVVGGGPAGMATALSLARRGRRVAILGRSPTAGACPGETLPPEVRLPLDALGVWGGFLACGAWASPGTVSAWSSTTLHEADHIANPFGCGWQVERGPFDAMLASAAEAEGCAWLRPAWPARPPRRSPSGWQIEALVGGERCDLRAGVVVDATGRSATLARSLGAPWHADDRLVGLVARHPASRTGRGDDRRTLVEAVEEGWWYSLPLADGGLTVGFVTDPDLLPRGRAGLAEFLAGNLGRATHTADRVGGVRPADGLRARPAGSSRLTRAAGERWVAVGDAASAWDPLSSQGVYRALVSGLEGARAIEGLLRGDRMMAMAYAESVAADHEDYLETRAGYYGMERRWANSPFWRKRQGRMLGLAVSASSLGGSEACEQIDGCASSE